MTDDEALDDDAVSPKPKKKKRAKKRSAEPSLPALLPPDTAMRSSLACVAISAVVITACAFGLSKTKHLVGVAVGGFVAWANLWAFSKLGALLLVKPSAGLGLAGVVKMILLFVGVFILFKRGVATPLEFVCGFAALPIGIVMGTLFAPLFGKKK